MNRNGAILFIEDDADDRSLFLEIMNESAFKNPVIFKDNANDALRYLEDEENHPFMIISDINMPGMNGLQLRDFISLDPVMNDKCVPFIFLSTSANPALVKEAFKSSIHGFFKKPNDYGELKILLHNVISYWKDSKAPA